MKRALKEGYIHNISDLVKKVVPKDGEEASKIEEDPKGTKKLKLIQK